MKPVFVLALWLLFVCGCSDVGSRRNAVRQRLANAIPVGLEASTAEIELRKQGFQVSRKADDLFGDRDHIDYLYADRMDDLGSVQQRFQIAVVLDKERVTEVIVTDGLVGP